VALVERKDFGGTCVNTGCMPTKTLVASAYAAHLARRAADYGVDISRPGRRRHEAGQGPRKDKVVLNARGNLEAWLRGMPGMHRLIAATPASRAPTPCGSATSC
jgi:pyruvate/2-oxoglutarate dehydrogenase complex dihydrolipoamide dehydrogenase (E3) component